MAPSILIIKSEGTNSCCYLLEEPHVALEAEPGVLKGRWLILFEHKMADPREAVAHHEHEKQVGQVEGEENGPDELQECEQGSDEVQPSADLVGVLREVKGVKLV